MATHWINLLYKNDYKTWWLKTTVFITFICKHIEVMIIFLKSEGKLGNQSLFWFS